MNKDPIVAEIHQIREDLWRECHASVEEMAQRQRKIQESVQGRLIDPEEWRCQHKAAPKRA
jgi:hypothetical protein